MTFTGQSGAEDRLRYPLLGGSDPEEKLRYDDHDVNEVREHMVKTGEMAFPTLCYNALEHASYSVTHLDLTISHAYDAWKKITPEEMHAHRQSAKQLVSDMKSWCGANPVKSFFMVAGLGGTAFKAKSISAWMKDEASAFIDLAASANVVTRFVLFVLLMTIRLVVSTLAPPTSPAFGIILQAATPLSQKWTAMPLFLLASTAAGAVPYCLDKLLQCGGADFRFSKFMHDFAGSWPLTCWTKPAMEKVFHATGGGVLGASTAVIVAHAAPFMGAQTTMMQRYFLPHPLDTIISQPFGMSEDLFSMAMAEAISDPALASCSITALVCSFNFARYFVFTEHGSAKDVCARLIGVTNLMIGIVAALLLPKDAGVMTFSLVFLQMITQMLFSPLFATACIPVSMVQG